MSLKTQLLYYERFFSFKAILAIEFTWKLCFDTWNEMFDTHQCTFVLFYFKNAKYKGKNPDNSF